MKLSVIQHLGLCLSAIVLACNSAEEVDSQLTGTVYDERTNQGLSDVLVEVRSNSINEVATARTDQTGVYSIRETLLPGEQYNVRFSLPGYEVASFTQTLSAGINRHDVPLKGGDCSLRVEPSAMQVSIDRTDGEFTLVNESSVTCPYRLSINNNGPESTRPLLSISPRADQSGVMGVAQNKVIRFTLDKANFNVSESSVQTINIVEENAKFVVSVTVERELGCDGCSSINTYGGPCPVDIRCDGCCSSDDQCISSGQLSTLQCPLDGIGSQCRSCLTSTLSCSSNESNQYSCVCLEPSVSAEPVLASQCQDVDPLKPCRQETVLGCNQGTINECVSCGSCDDNIQNQGETGVDCGGPCPSACPPRARQLILRPQASKILRFEWSNSSDATFYQLFESEGSNASDSYVAISSELSGDVVSYDYTVPLFEKKGRYYKIRACNVIGCVDSNVVQAADLTNSIGKLLADNSDSSDNFGFDVDTNRDGTVLVIGAPGEAGPATPIGANGAGLNTRPFSGAAYIFTRGDDNSWNQTAYLKASNAGSSDRFGTSVAISKDGKTVAVGAYLEDGDSLEVNGPQDNDNRANSGAVYIYTQALDGSWSQQAYIKAPNADSYDGFGEAVDLNADGTVLAVGAPNESSTSVNNDSGLDLNDGNLVGAAYIFVRNEGTWSHQGYIKARNSANRLFFGMDVSLSDSGARLVVGAPGDDNEAGAAYIYVVRRGRFWTNQAYLKASNTDSSDEFGYSVKISGDGDTVIVGAKGESSRSLDATDNGQPSAGAAYIFKEQFNSGTTTWPQQAYIKPDYILPTATLLQFGYDVDISYDGTTIAVSCLLESSSARGINGDPMDNSAPGSGAVYIFKKETTQWRQTAYVKGRQAISGARFGESIALSNDAQSLTVGAAQESNTSIPDHELSSAGSVYSY